VPAVARIAGVDESTVRRWMMPREKKGGGGLIPARHQQVLLQWARDNRIKLKAEDFFASNAAVVVAV
jgi:phage terminase Nu1 subunit (DNA packaging protein)